ncbi:helix-turn-helix transcriptional regulator [Pseudactinotalea sp. Z1739]|uniref:helix-turn-helix transcriptional regulator n=1 Tax=Pseudactinotalea sp. Z1739 TaxID=3413028 RepID=UPI003C7D06F2
MRAENSADRVVRLLALVSYLDDHPGVRVAQVAEHFGVSEAQVLKDVDTLWVSGTPGYQHNDLIDFAADDHERNILTLIEPQGMETPLRLGAVEAVSLLVALRSLAETAGAGEQEVVASALEKLTAAAGSAAHAARSIDVGTGRSGTDGIDDRLDQVRTAIEQGRQLHLRYVSAADVVSHRTVDPLRLLTDSQRYFLHAWCHRAQDLRQFRVDRILDLEVLEASAADHSDLHTADTPDPELASARWRVRLELASRARWVAEQFEVAGVTELGEGRFAVQIDVVDPSWLRNLVLSLGPDVLAVSPPEVAAELSDFARQALKAYDEDAAATGQ